MIYWIKDLKCQLGLHKWTIFLNFQGKEYEICSWCLKNRKINANDE